MHLLRKLSRRGRRSRGGLADNLQNESTCSLPLPTFSRQAPNPPPYADTAPSVNEPLTFNSSRFPTPMGTLTPLVYSSHLTAVSAISLSIPTDKHNRVLNLAPARMNPKENAPPENSPLPWGENLAWSGLKALLRVLEASTELFGPLKMAIEELNQCIKTYESIAEGHKEYNTLRAELDDLLGDLAGYVRLESAPMTGSIIRLCRVIEVELQTITKKQNRRQVAHYIAAYLGEDPLANDILECYRRINDHVGRLAMNANLSLRKTVDEYIMDSRLEKLAPSKSAAYNAGLSVGVSRGPCAPGTRLEEINRLLTWACEPDEEGVCWLNGMAGTGKTTIAYSFCNRLDDNGQLAASFYCSRAIDKCKDVRMIIPTVAYQLARFSYPFQCALSQVLSEDPDAATRDLELQFKALISEPLQRTRGTLPPDCVIVIDALDECEDSNSTGKFLNILLSSFQGLPIRFLVSSRPEPEIYKQMTSPSGPSAYARLVLHELSSSTVRHDITKYLDRELQGIPLEDFKRAGLIEQCGVLFIYASTAVRYIKDGYELEEHKERLDTILGLTATAHSEGNQEIDELYSMILSTAWNYSKFNTSNIDQMKILLHSIVCAQEPMTLEALAGLLKLKDAQRVNALLRPLCSVIHVADETGLVSALHASFPDFLYNRCRSGDFPCPAANHHCYLALACFTALETNETQFNIGKLTSSYELDRTITSDQAKKSISFSLVYACRYWATHLLLGQPDKGSNLLVSLKVFLSSRLLLWMEVLNLKKIMHEGVAVLQRIAGWCQTQHLLGDITELANDAWQFVSTYANHPISHSTPHIYVSMLAFWPPSRPVSKYYVPRTHQVPTPSGAAVTQRNPSLLATWSFDQPVKSTRFSSNGQWVILAAGRRVYILDRYTGKITLDSLEVHTETVNSVSFAADSSFALSGSNDGTIHKWSPTGDHQPPKLLVKHDNPVLSFEISSDGSRLVLSLGNNSVCIHSTHDGQQLLAPIQLHGDRICSVLFAHDDAQFVCGLEDKTLSIWDSQSGEAICDPLQGHNDSICSLATLPLAPTIISGSRDATIRIWNSQDGRMIKGPLKGHTSSVSSIAVSPDGLYIASGSHDCTIRIWNTRTGETEIGPLVGHIKAINSVSFSPDAGGVQIVSGSQDGTLRLWNVERSDPTNKPRQRLTDSIRSARFSPDGTFVASGSEIGTIRLWDTQNGQVFGSPLKGHVDWIYSIDISPDGACIASGSKDKTIRLWDTQTGQNIRDPMEGHSAAINSVRFSPDSTLVVSGSDDHTIRLWNVKNGQLAMDPLEGHTDAVVSVAFSPNGTQVASASRDRTVRIWGLNGEKPSSMLLSGHTDFVVSVHFSPDGLRLVSGSHDKGTIIWDICTGQMLTGPLYGHNDRVAAVAFSPNGNFIASGSYDSTICLWDSESGRLMAGPLEGHTGYIEGVQFSPDSSRILSCSSDRTIRFWEVERMVDPPPEGSSGSYALLGIFLAN
ncbi:unnamed protein product [Rhizoctonia solani]|uniref:Nephrocystin 3-like N-terminal domain-containing protein n=1 Tax=Rhizoctonia solani TaxID=456999 RepID=A0A8H3AK57_9AGAM|nr:unnamed protein product [Rhizoctonia solani]